MLFSVRNGIRSTILTVTLCAASSAKAGWLGVELQGGTVNVTSSHKQEIDKKGSAFGGYLFYGDRAPGGTWGLGLGLQSADVRGRDPSRGVKQDFDILSPFVDARYMYDWGHGLSTGVSIRNQFGKGARYAVREVDEWAYVFAPGAVVQYELSSNKWHPTASLSYYTDANNSDRQVRTLLFGIGASIGPRIKNVADVKPAPVQAAPKAVLVETPPVAPATPPAPVVVTLDAKAVNFDVNKSTLKPISKKKLERLADALVKHDAIWKGLKVSGHTDASGRKDSNLKLSAARAEAVCTLFVKNGVKREKLTCTGHGSERLLPDLAPNAAEHRRVELAFDGVNSNGATTLNSSISDALKD